MKPLSTLLPFLLCGLALDAQEMIQSEAETEEVLPIPSSVFVPPPPPKQVPPMRVEAATTRHFPTHQITVLRGEASTLPDIPPPPEPTPFVQRPVGEPFYHFSFGATVYDRRLSHVRWHDPGTKEVFEAWCAWDWTLLSPIHKIDLGQRVRSFHLFASNIDTQRWQLLGRQWKMPEHPGLEDHSFAITKGGADNTEAIRILTIIRDYYTKHKERLLQIRQAQEEYQAAAAAWHAANPPKPQSHTFWLKPHRGSRYLKEEGGDR
jgi:hypothetical protein